MTPLKKSVHITGLYTVLHPAVDFCTVNLVLSAVLSRGGSPAERAYAIILYNFIAFACQFPLGIIADKLDRNSLVAAAGCLLAAVAYPLRFAPYAACCIAAAGNALFHIGGGIDVLNVSGGRASLPGIFVSSGALGLWLAYRFAGDVGFIFPPAAMLVSAAALFLLHRENRRNYDIHNAAFTVSVPNAAVISAGACLMLTIVIRSYMGMIMDFEWKTGILSFAFTAAVVLGKALGGIFADRLGWAKLTCISLAASAALFLFSFRLPAAGIAAVFLFNMTMPVTLTALAGISGKKYGLAFGLTTLALFIGFVPVTAGKDALFSPAWLAVGSAVSAVLMLFGLSAFDRAKEREHD